MRLLAPALAGLAGCLVSQADATSLEGTFNSPANVSARARVQKPPRCPSQCDTYDTSQWFVYPGVSRVARCNETMLLDFMVYNPLNSSDSRNSIRSCVSKGTGMPDNTPAATSCYPVSSKSESTYQVGFWDGAGSKGPGNSGEGSSILEDISSYMVGNCQKKVNLCILGVWKHSSRNVCRW